MAGDPVALMSGATTQRLADAGALAAAVIALPTSAHDCLIDRSWAMIAWECEALVARARRLRARRS